MNYYIVLITDNDIVFENLEENKYSFDIRKYVIDESTMINFKKYVLLDKKGVIKSLSTIMKIGEKPTPIPRILII